jgi:pilus assembly protein CpaB
VTARRTMILVVALVIGMIAAIALYSYVGSVDNRAYADAQLVEVYVVKKDITKGTYGEDAVNNGLLEKDEIPLEFRPANALSNLDPIRGKVAITNLSKDQVIVDGLFVAPNQVPGGAFSTNIDKGMVAVTVTVDQVRGVGGNLLPGDRVNVLVTGVDGSRNVQYLYQNVKILAIGQNAAPGVGETEQATNPGSDLITFVVPPEAAQRIVYAGSENLYLTLVPKDNEAVDLGPVTKDNLFSDHLTPYPAED